jgi:fructokinase
MKHHDCFKLGNPKPTCVGTGLVALDVMINGNPQTPEGCWTGGSCGNVLTILSYLGWKSFPLAKLGNDPAAAEIFQDIHKWNVNTSLISVGQPGDTPIIIERIEKRENGSARHHFEWFCPVCHSRLPRYHSILAEEIERFTAVMPRASTFYFDRVTPGALELARRSKKKGALVFFEPSRIKNEELFCECAELADIVKYSNENAKQIGRLTKAIDIPLEIETLGKEGLRYRLARNGKRNRVWKLMPAYTVPNFRDAAGSGDWCSAGLVYALGNRGRGAFNQASERKIRVAMNFGQALAALNCCYEGARGIMYRLSRREFKLLVDHVMECKNQLVLPEKELDSSNRRFQPFQKICPNCPSRRT